MFTIMPSTAKANRNGKVSELSEFTEYHFSVKLFLLEGQTIYFALLITLWQWKVVKVGLFIYLVLTYYGFIHFFRLAAKQA